MCPDSNGEDVVAELPSGRVHLQNEIKEVRLSSRLTSSPVCLVSDEHDLTPRMQKMLEQMGQAPPKIKPILEQYLAKEPEGEWAAETRVMLERLND